ncbi:hypothetical protein [Vibrio sp. D431a]|uniref:hypothetical protein n=1 Tax=Vibrio sp. D431a TaxID=2837388 RepID=UPI002556333F|nr:hypothetical protein [Vibrio sp. D431a]MDK9793873.1 hypothetical protein [Vibrio sp. D431a]
MTDKYLSFSEMAEVEALKVNELCHGAVDPERNNSQELDANARQTIFQLAKDGRFNALNKAYRSLENYKDASFYYEICEGEAISTSIQEADGKKYLCTTMFIPLSFSLSPFEQGQEYRSVAAIKPILPNIATKSILELLTKHFGGDFDVLPFLLDAFDVYDPRSKRKVQVLSQLYSTLSLSKKLGNTAGHDERFVEYLSNNFDTETPFDFSRGEFDVCKLVMINITEEIHENNESPKQTLGMGLPVKLISQQKGADLANERGFINDVTNAIQEEYFKIEEFDIYVSAGSPQLYTMLDLGGVIAEAGTVVKHMSSILSEVAHCDLTVEVDRESSEITLSYKFKRSLDEYDDENLILKIPYVPFRMTSPLTEIELKQSFIQHILGISCTLKVEP